MKERKKRKGRKKARKKEGGVQIENRQRRLAEKNIDGK